MKKESVEEELALNGICKYSWCRYGAAEVQAVCKS